MLFTKVPASGVWLFVRGGLCLKAAPPSPASRLNISEWREDKAARSVHLDDALLIIEVFSLCHSTLLRAPSLPRR